MTESPKSTAPRPEQVLKSLSPALPYWVDHQKSRVRAARIAKGPERIARMAKRSIACDTLASARSRQNPAPSAGSASTGTTSDGAPRSERHERGQRADGAGDEGIPDPRRRAGYVACRGYVLAHGALLGAGEGTSRRGGNNYRVDRSLARWRRGRRATESRSIVEMPRFPRLLTGARPLLFRGTSSGPRGRHAEGERVSPGA